MFTKIYSWLVVSSADPTKISMTLKGVGVTLIPIIGAIVVTFTGVKIESDLVLFLDGAVSLVGIGLTLFGLGRKIFLSFR